MTEHDLITRVLAILPAVLVIGIAGEGKVTALLILSQVVLSFQLPFAVIPLIHLTNDPLRMGAFASPRWVRMLAWATAAVIVGLNLRLAALALADWVSGAGVWKPLALAVAAPIPLLLMLLLGWILIEPALTRHRRLGVAPVTMPDLHFVAEGQSPSVEHVR